MMKNKSRSIQSDSPVRPSRSRNSHPAFLVTIDPPHLHPPRVTRCYAELRYLTL